MSTTTSTAGLVTVGGPIRIERWPSELPLFAVAAAFGILIWIPLVITILPLLYVAAIGLLLFLVHVGFVAHVRGSGVRLGPDQFPELHARVQDLAKRMGIEKVPAAYIMQAGGALNALATRFLRSHLIVLFSDLLEACGDNQAARDMIIGHELGHIRARHLRYRWLIAPAALIPFLLTALSRAREYTCDRYGLAAAGDRDGALLGLAILAAGGKHGPRVNRTALVHQRQDLATGFMTLGTWLSTHPPLAKRLVALDPSLGQGQNVSAAGPVRALGIIFLFLLSIGFVGWLAVSAITRFATFYQNLQFLADPTSASAFAPPPAAEARAQLQTSVNALVAFLDAELAAGRQLPADLEELGSRWDAAYPGTDLPMDPYDGASVGYTRTANGFDVWSSGPDQESGTADDITFPFQRPAGSTQR